MYRNTVRARVVSKSSVKTYDTNQHKLFYFDIMDDSASLRVKAFDRQCDRIFARVCIGEVCTFLFNEKFSLYINVLFCLYNTDD